MNKENDKKSYKVKKHYIYVQCEKCGNKKVKGAICHNCIHKQHLKDMDARKN